MKIRIENGMIVSHEKRYGGNILIRDGIVSAITEPGCKPNAEVVIDAKGKFILPGVIDSHVHFQDPGFTHREEFESATAAAAVGGVTTAISHPMNDPPIVDVESYNFTMEAYRGRGYIDYGIHGGGTSNNIDKIEALWNKTGAISIKMFMCNSVEEFPFVRDDAMYEIMQKVAASDGLVMIHAENNELIQMEEKRLKMNGRIDPAAYHESHSMAGELEAVKRAIYFLEITGARGVILHSGMESALREIKLAKDRGVKVFAECCPHFFTFVDSDLTKLGPYLKFSPVMRDEKNRRQLWKMLSEGYIDTIGSDHSPYTEEEKLQGIHNIWNAPNGIPGIQNLLTVLLDGASKGLVSLEKIVAVTSYNPSRIYGLDYRKGTLEVGKDADLVLVDMDREKEFTKADILSKAKWSPYVGRQFKGWPVLTMVRGKIVAQDGIAIGNPGHGIYISRKKMKGEELWQDMYGRKMAAGNGMELLRAMK